MRPSSSLFAVTAWLVFPLVNSIQPNVSMDRDLDKETVKRLCREVLTATDDEYLRKYPRNRTVKPFWHYCACVLYNPRTMCTHAEPALHRVRFDVLPNPRPSFYLAEEQTVRPDISAPPSIPTDTQPYLIEPAPVNVTVELDEPIVLNCTAKFVDLQPEFKLQWYREKQPSDALLTSTIILSGRIYLEIEPEYIYYDRLSNDTLVFSVQYPFALNSDSGWYACAMQSPERGQLVQRELYVIVEKYFRMDLPLLCLFMSMMSFFIVATVTVIYLQTEIKHGFASLRSWFT